jgi:hypothetical protein
MSMSMSIRRIAIMVIHLIAAAINADNTDSFSKVAQKTTLRYIEDFEIPLRIYLRF